MVTAKPTSLAREGLLGVEDDDDGDDDEEGGSDAATATLLERKRVTVVIRVMTKLKLENPIVRSANFLL